MTCRAVVLFALTGPLAPWACADRSLLDEGWRFTLDDVGRAHLPDCDDSRWRRVDLPHDWSIESPTNAKAPSGGSGGYHRAGAGWYRRKLPPRPRTARWFIEFDGAYHNAEVWLDGHRLGRHRYGFTPFGFEITDRTNDSTSGALSVRVDNSDQPNCRWYTGSGLYRHVWLRQTGASMIEPDSVWVATNCLTRDAAEVRVAFTVDSNATAPTPCEAVVTVSAPDGGDVGSQTVSLRASSSTPHDARLTIVIPSPQPWSPRSPSLYTLRIDLLSATGEKTDSVRQHFGVRTVVATADEGLLLNGQPTKLLGGNVHHDHGLLGAASFDLAEQRRARLLKSSGFNAVRTAHNPPSTAFLDACDQIGLLVIDEAFDGWRKSKVAHDYGEDFDACWRQDLAKMVRRDRRHPCVIMWSIGNEMYERGDLSGLTIAQEAKRLIRDLDPSRPITAGVNGLGDRPWSKLDPLFRELDIAGYNYEADRFAADYDRVPSRVMYSSESYPSDVVKTWREVHSRSYVIGDFAWSAIDYLGEAGIGRRFPDSEAARPHWEGDHYPWRGATCGEIDLLGRRKPISHTRNIVWDRGESLYVSIHDPKLAACTPTKWSTPPTLSCWTWDVSAGEELTARIASRWPQVELILNGERVRKKAADEASNFIIEFDVPYEEGVLTAVGLDKSGVEQERFSLETASEPVRVKLVADHHAGCADRQTITHVDVALVDAQGRVHPWRDRPVRFSVEGPAEIIAVGNADLSNGSAYAADCFDSYRGRLQVVLRSTGVEGEAVLTGSAEGLDSARLTLGYSQ